MAAPAPEAPAWPGMLRSAELKDKVSKARILCVGAGGIGCELLKTLVCSGFRHITVIDLDTIETSNLNRQFLFRKHHVGQSKASTAAAVVSSMRKDVNIEAHHANIKEGRFDVDFFAGFDLVLNGLDNLEARRHVNRLCLAANKPLVESGTAGYLGQVTVHIKGVTECFECRPKPAPKSFPICTLRNTPDKPIHCIVWAKDLLFNRLFGKPEEVTDLDDQPNKDGQAANGGQQADAMGQQQEQEDEQQAQAPADDPSFFARRDDETPVQYAARVFTRVYTDDIQRLAAIKDMWEKRPPPTALLLEELMPDTQAQLKDLEHILARQSSAGTVPMSACRELGLTNPNVKWSTQDSVRVLLLAIAMYLTHRGQEVGSLVFDKDDDLAVDFVTASSNLRATCYAIPTQSLFDAKGMAGNIIHAIATTNAITAGLIVTEAFKLLAGCIPACRTTFLLEHPNVGRKSAGARLLTSAHPEGPKPKCMVCSRTQLTLRINTQTTTLGALLSGVVRKQLAVNQPNLLCGGFMFEEGEGLEEDEVAEYAAMLPRPLASLPGGGLKHGSLLSVQDQSQHFGVELLLVHQEKFDEESYPEGFILEGDTSKAQAQADEATAASKAPEEAEPPAALKPKAALQEDESGRICLDSDDESGPAAAEAKPSALGKRRREDVEEKGGEGQGEADKRAKVAEPVPANDDDCVVIDD